VTLARGHSRGAGEKESSGERQEQTLRVGGFEERHDDVGAPAGRERLADETDPSYFAYTTTARGGMEELQTKRNLRRAIIFGVVMATIEIGVLLYFMYC
jgi:hypothetical protein